MRVLGLSSYPLEAAATRFRMAQYIEPLSKRGIELTLSPFLRSNEFQDLYDDQDVARKLLPFSKSFFRRLTEVLASRRYDLLFVQREAMPFGPAVFEWLHRNLKGIPMVLDLDDATYIPYVSPNFGRVGSALKFFGKTDKLIKRAAVVICGNRFIAEYAQSLGVSAIVIPTIVDTSEFNPKEHSNERPVIGWIGTHSTLPSVEWLFSVIQRLALKYEFVFKVVGAGCDVSIDGVMVESKAWSLESEIDDFRSLDIGLYPIVKSGSANQEWIEGKSGFKAIEYMAVGVPFVMSPVGVCAEIGIPGETHFNALTHEDWYNHLDVLLSDKELRKRMGNEGRHFSIANYDLEDHADRLAATLGDVVNAGCS